MLSIRRLASYRPKGQGEAGYEAAKSDIQKSGFRMATPLTTRLSVLPAKVAADHLIHDR